MSANHLEIRPGAGFMATYEVGDGRVCQFRIFIHRVLPRLGQVMVIETGPDGFPNLKQGEIGPFPLRALREGRYGDMKLSLI